MIITKEYFVGVKGGDYDSDHWKPRVYEVKCNDLATAIELYNEINSLPTEHFPYTGQVYWIQKNGTKKCDEVFNIDHGCIIPKTVMVISRYTEEEILKDNLCM